MSMKNNDEMGLYLIAFIRENILNSFGNYGICYAEIEKFCGMLNDEINKCSFLETYTGVTFTKTFTPNKKDYGTYEGENNE